METGGEVKSEPGDILKPLSTDNHQNLRRERRRRKILENAESRLSRLNGNTYDSDDTGQKKEDSCEYSDPEVEPNIIPEYVPATPLNHMDDFSPLDALHLLDTKIALKLRKQFFMKTRIHIFVVVVVAYMFAALGFSYICGVFIPAGLVITGELIFYREQHRNNPIWNLLLTMSGIQVTKVNRILYCLSMIQSLVVDVGIMLFLVCILTYTLISVNIDFVYLADVK